jgi:DtxR family Mn-dependent transcriptional regulator
LIRESNSRAEQAWLQDVEKGFAWDKLGGQYDALRGEQPADNEGSLLTAAMEDCLEMIARLRAQAGYVRVGMLSEALQVRASSASKMVTRLRQLHYVDFDSNDNIIFSAAGSRIAAYLLHRHDIVERFLLLLGSKQPASETEQAEHYLSPDTVQRLAVLVQFMDERKIWPDFYAVCPLPGQGESKLAADTAQ